MTSSDPHDRSDPPEPDADATRPAATDAEDTSDAPRPKRRFLIGSQRDPAAYHPKPKRDWTPLEDEPQESGPPPAATAENQTAGPPAGQPEAPEAPAEPAEPAEPSELAVDEGALLTDADQESLLAGADYGSPPESDGPKKYPLPNIRAELSADLEEEFQEALAGAELDELMTDGEAVTKQVQLDSESKLTGRVVAVRRDDVFMELGGREQGILPLSLFEEPPEVGATAEVRVVRFNADDGIYELTLRGVAAAVADWDDLEEGMIVEAQITGHNTGGLECEVSRIPGFIPISQIALYRVEDLEPFLGQKLACLVTEVNPRRGNLVLSHRAILEREKEEARRQLLESLAPGQVYEGVVRKLMDFGAFVDIGGVDGLLHVSQLSWARVNHPRDVLTEGQTIKVRIDKFDAETGRISLSYRDMLENPWTDAEQKYPPSMKVEGKVTKLMEFGAFVELEPGVEGLIHISELSHKHVGRASEVVHEGDQVEVLVLSTDAEAQRISLSIKELAGELEPPADEEPAPKKPQEPSKPLKGGLGRSPQGQDFGLKW